VPKKRADTSGQKITVNNEQKTMNSKNKPIILDFSSLNLKKAIKKNNRLTAINTRITAREKVRKRPRNSNP